MEKEKEEEYEKNEENEKQEKERIEKIRINVKRYQAEQRYIDDLYKAIDEKDLATVGWILDRVPSLGQYCVLMRAVNVGDMEVCQYIGVYCTPKVRTQCFFLAIRKSEAIAQMFIGQGLEDDAMDPIIKQGSMTLFMSFFASKSFCEDEEAIEKWTELAAEHGSLEIFDFFVHNFPSLLKTQENLKKYLNLVILGNFWELFIRLIDLKAVVDNDHIIMAAGCGHLDILIFLLDSFEKVPVSLLNECLVESSSNGHLETTKELMRRGANNFDEGVRSMVRYECLPTFDFLVTGKIDSSK